MVFAELTTLVQSQWLLLRDVFGAEGHEHRVQQRLDKKRAKQQQKAARKAARQARKALRKQPPPTIIVEAAEPPRPYYKRTETLSEPRGLAWAQTTDVLPQLSANDRARFFKSEPTGEGRDESGPLQDPSPECVGACAGPQEAASAVVKVLPPLPPELTPLELEAQLEQKQRDFYDSLGGYSTLDEEEDELHEQLAAARSIRETKLPAKWTVVGIKKTVPATVGRFKLPTALEEEVEEREDTSPTGQAQLPSDHKTKAFTSSEELVDTEPEDDGVDLRDSDAFDGYSTFDENEAQELFIADHEFDGLCAPRSLFSPAVSTADTDVLEAKVDPSCVESEPVLKVDLDDMKEVTSKRFEMDRSDQKMPVISALPNNIEAFAMVQTHFTDDEVVGVSSLEGKPDEITDSESEEGVEIIEVIEEIVDTELISEAIEIVEVLEEEAVMTEEPMHPASDAVFAQSCLSQTPQPTSVAQDSGTAGVYAPGVADEYACVIYENLRAREHRYHVTEDIFANQKTVTPKMRSVLVDWLVEVHQRFELEEQTLYLTVNYIDRYLAQAPVKSQRFQLIGVAALLVASKFEEVYPCDMDDLLYICERSYSKADLVDCERSLLNIFKFNLAVPSVSSFLGYYLDHFDEDDLISQLAKYFSERSLLDFSFGANYEPSTVACACLLAAYCYVENQTPALVWNYRLVEVTGYAVDAVLPCARDLWSILIQPSDLTAVATKYSTKEYGEVAHLPLEDLEALLS